MAAAKTVGLIMAGGSGTRFWPLSRRQLPKQYITFGKSGRSLIQMTVDRLSPLIQPSDIYVCAHQSHEPVLREQLPQVGGLFLEPMAKNTTACLLYSLATLKKLGFGPDTRMVALPADHFIQFEDKFRTCVELALNVANQTSSLVTLGIVPTRPHTGYGYIETRAFESGGAYPVLRFVEKPTAEVAQRFIESGTFYWNSGMFIWTLGALEMAFREFVAADWERMNKAVLHGSVESAYQEIKSTPIDISLMEKAKNVSLIKGDQMGWTDLGSWNALYELESKHAGSNVILKGVCKSVQSEGCLVRTSPQKKVALVGVKDLIVVEEGDTILIAHRNSDQLVRELAEEFDKT